MIITFIIGFQLWWIGQFTVNSLLCSVFNL